jgi:hypothetical protein
VWVTCALDKDLAHVRQSPDEQYLKGLISLIVTLTCVAPALTYVCPHAGIIVLRRLVLFRKIPPRSLLYWLPGLQVDD